MSANGNESLCGRMFGPVADAPRFCTLAKGHKGECGEDCGAKLERGGKVRVCERAAGHDGDHRCLTENGDGPAVTYWPAEATGAVLPSETDGAPPDGSEGASGAQDAPEEASDGGAERDRDGYSEETCVRCGAAEEEIEVTAPQFSSEMRVTSMMFWVQRHPDGARELKIVGAARTPAGLMPSGPAYCFYLTDEGWKNLRQTIEDDGAPKPHIVRATHLPPGVEM